MRKLIIAATAALCFAGVGTSFGDPVVTVDDPTGQFTDSSGNAGYVQVDDSGAVRACNENSGTPAADQATGYAYVSAGGESGGHDGKPSNGNANIGTDDSDGEGAANGNDCP